MDIGRGKTQLAPIQDKNRQTVIGCLDQPPSLLCSCMPSVATHTQRAARRVDRRAQWLPICRCSSCLLMHIKPTPPASRTSHPAFSVSGILINCTDRKPLWSTYYSAPPLLFLFHAEIWMHLDVAFPLHPWAPARRLRNREGTVWNSNKRLLLCRNYVLESTLFSFFFLHFV